MKKNLELLSEALSKFDKVEMITLMSVELNLKSPILIFKKKIEPIRTKVKVKVIKNKVTPQFKKAGFDIIYGEGVSIVEEIK